MLCQRLPGVLGKLTHAEDIHAHSKKYRPLTGQAVYDNQGTMQEIHSACSAVSRQACLEGNMLLKLNTTARVDSELKCLNQTESLGTFERQT